MIGSNYVKKNGEYETHHLDAATIDRLCAGLSLHRGKLLAAFRASAGRILGERRSEIAKDILNRPLNEISNTRLRHVLMERNKKSAKTRTGKGKNPKNQRRLAAQWREIKADPDRHARQVEKVQHALARFQHPSDRDRVVRGWGIFVAWCRRKGQDAPSSADRERFVQKWAGQLGVDAETIERELQASEGAPRPGRMNQLTLDAYLHIKRVRESDRQKTWEELRRDIHERFGIETDSWRHLLDAYRKADKSHGRPVVKKSRIRPFQRRRRWTPEEVAYLRTHYADTPVEDVAHHLGKSPRQVMQKASRLGITQPTLPLPTYVAPEAKAAFREYVAHVQGAGYTRSSRSRLLSAARQLLTFTAGVPVESLIDDHTDRFPTQRLTPSSARTKRDALRHFLRFVQGRQPH